MSHSMDVEVQDQDTSKVGIWEDPLLDMWQHLAYSHVLEGVRDFFRVLIPCGGFTLLT